MILKSHFWKHTQIEIEVMISKTELHLHVHCRKIQSTQDTELSDNRWVGKDHIAHM